MKRPAKPHGSARPAFPGLVMDWNAWAPWMPTGSASPQPDTADGAAALTSPAVTLNWTPGFGG